MAQCGGMVAKHITLSAPVAEAIRSQIATGRYKDLSAALNDAAWNHFVGPASPFADYGVTVREVEAAAAKDLALIKKLRAAGRLEKL